MSDNIDERIGYEGVTEKLKESALGAFELLFVNFVIYYFLIIQALSKSNLDLSAGLKALNLAHGVLFNVNVLWFCGSICSGTVNLAT